MVLEGIREVYTWWGVIKEDMKSFDMCERIHWFRTVAEVKPRKYR